MHQIGAAGQEVAVTGILAATALVPRGSKAVLALVLPLTRAFVLSGTPLVENTTLPVGVPPAELTLAVKVTFDPGPDGFKDEISAVAELAGVTVSVPFW